MFYRGESDSGSWVVCGEQSEDELVAEKKCVAHLIGEVSWVPNRKGDVCVCMGSECVAPLIMNVREGQRV